MCLFQYDRSIEDIADILVSQFEGEMGDRMRAAYGEFCSRHNEAVQLYKDILKSDRKFHNFIKVSFNTEVEDSFKLGLGM